MIARRERSGRESIGAYGRESFAAYGQPRTLQEASCPVAAAEARRTLEAAFGRKVHDVFEHVEYAAVGTGSVACVYRARLRSGGEVALKLRRPGVERAMALDLRLI